MIWLAPWAFLGLLFLAGPVLIHLLARQRATRIVFPAMRFVPPVSASAVRIRRLSDAGLLLLRAGAIAAAVAATAQPLLKTPASQRAWAHRVARAVIQDTSASVSAGLAGPLADAEMRGVFVSEKFADVDLRDALRRAEEWLTQTPAGSREIAIVSDFQAGAIDAVDIASVPPSTAIRLVRAGRPSLDRERPIPVDGWRDGRWTPSLVVGAGATDVTWTLEGQPASTITILTAPAEAAAGEAAARAARSFGVAVSEEPRPIEVAFAGAQAPRTALPTTPWIAAAAIAMRTSPLTTATGAPLDVGERDGVLSVRTGLPASSPFAAAIVRAVLLAAHPVVVDHEREITALDEPTLAAWRRPAVPLPIVPPDATDGRWWWGAALALVLVEGVARRRPVSRPEAEVHAHAA